MIINLETDALGSADGTVQGIDVDLEVREASSCCCAAPHALLLCCAPRPCCCAAPLPHVLPLPPLPTPLQRVTVDGVRVGDDLEDIFEDDDPREDTMVSFSLPLQRAQPVADAQLPCIHNAATLLHTSCHDRSPVCVSRRS